MPYDNITTGRNRTMSSISKWGREHPNEVYAPEGAENVKRDEAGEYGYWGIRQDPRPQSDYTVAGVTGTGSGGGEDEGAGVQTMSARTTSTKSSSKS